MQCANAFSCTCACVCRILTFENLDLESSFLVYQYIYRMSVPWSHIKVIGSSIKVMGLRSRSCGQAQGHTNVTKCAYSQLDVVEVKASHIIYAR